MRFIRLLSICCLVITTLLSEAVFAKDAKIAETFKFIKQKKWVEGTALAKRIGDPALIKIITAERLLDDSFKQNTFEAGIKFFKDNKHWPQKKAIRSKAELYINASTDPKLIVDWFSKYPPLTGNGHKYYAIAAANLIKDQQIVKNLIKKGWIYGCFNQGEEKEYYDRFHKYLTSSDHVKKIDNLLWRGSISRAKSFMKLAPESYKQAFMAHVSFINEEKDAISKYRKVPAEYRTSGLIYSYLLARKKDMKNSGVPGAAEVLGLIQRVKDDSTHADDFCTLQLYHAREYLEQKRYADAYKMAASYFASSEDSVRESEFLAGWVALRYLNKPDAALKHFTKLEKSVKRSISKSRGLYWIGRAYSALGDQKKAQEYYTKAADKYGFTIYGQIATAELKRNKLKILETHSKGNVNYLKTDAFRALRLVAAYGNKNMLKTYAKSIIDHIDSTEDLIALAHDADMHIKNHNYRVEIGKLATQYGVFIKRLTFPTPYRVPYDKVETSLTYAIMRQESVFDPHAISSANARGLMQLVDVYACDTAKRIGVKCQVDKLTKDPHYNILLGTNHLYGFLQKYNGSYILAIAAYNAGPNRVKRWIEVFGDPRKAKNMHEIVDWMELVPYYETRGYIHRVIENLQVYRAIHGSKFMLLDDFKRGRG